MLSDLGYEPGRWLFLWFWSFCLLFSGKMILGRFHLKPNSNSTLVLRCRDFRMHLSCCKRATYWILLGESPLNLLSSIQTANVSLSSKLLKKIYYAGDIYPLVPSYGFYFKNYFTIENTKGEKQNCTLYCLLPASKFSFCKRQHLDGITLQNFFCFNSIPINLYFSYLL